MTASGNVSEHSSGNAAGVFNTTLGLAERFGKKRVRNTPISETAIAGAAMGAAMAGLRPVAEIMFSDFYGVCWDEVAVEIAKARYMTGGQFGAAARDPRGQRRRHRVRRPAQPVGRELGAVRARPQDRLARHARRCRRADRRGHPGRRPGAGVRAQGALRAARVPCPTASTCCRSARPPCCARATTSRWSGSRSPWGCAWPRPTGSPRRASPPRSSTCARSCRSTWPRCCARCGAPGTLSLPRRTRASWGGARRSRRSSPRRRSRTSTGRCCG